MKHFFPAVGALLGLTSLVGLLSFPQATMTNGLVQAQLYLPDTRRGYYQGTRFDWAGVVGRLQYQNHTYFGLWYENHDPKRHDAISGPVEEFTAIGYDQAQPGGAFLKIGVGMLQKPDTSRYRFFKAYPMVNGGAWHVNRRKDQVTFTQELTDSSGYAYHYRKTLKLLKGKPVLVLEHSLKNTGRNPIETNVYNHNFLVIDQ